MDALVEVVGVAVVFECDKLTLERYSFLKFEIDFEINVVKK